MKLFSLFTTYSLAITLVALSAHASPTRGTMVAFHVIQPGTAVMFSGLDLRGNETTDIFVGAAGGDVRCSVFTAVGAPVVLDAGDKNVCCIKVKPKKAGRYTLLVTNIDTKSAARATVTIQ